jgi:2-polyprenyl-3-methyl-5-hydroxy-6-metoxy-1,4-benzoquinol methylase
MAEARCRVCGVRLPAAPILALHEMPASAQAFPTAETLADDRPLPLDIHQCLGCGLVQLACKPVPYFREVIRAAAYSPEMGAFRRKQFRDWTQRYRLERQPVLEIGCGRGEYLTLLREAGMNASGIEYSTANLKACRASGLPARRGFLARAGQRLQGGPFAAFACFNFMEHWPDPVGSLRAIAEQLRPDGIGFVEVPNFDMILEKALYSEFIADHLSYFTAETLDLTLRLAGFEIIEAGNVWQDYILSAVVRKRPPLDVTPLTLQQARMRQQLTDFIAGYPPGQVAVWGAGHQALATIALTGIAPQLRYVIDSAPFKQGKFTPATHLPVVAPEHLETDPVQAVIVMAAAYSDEVASQIRTRFSPALSMRILRDDHLEPA